MGRSTYKYWSTALTGGHCEQSDQAQSNQLVEGRNLWAPDGVLKSRPGYIGQWSFFTHALHGTTSADTDEVVIKNDGGTITAYKTGNGAELDSLIARQSGTAAEVWYIGWADLPTSLHGVFFHVTAAAEWNSNGVWAYAEYYDGTNWKRLNFVESSITDDSSLPAENLQKNASHILPSSTANDYWALSFVKPSDWGTTSLTATEGDTGTYTKYFIRFTLMQGSGTTLDVETEFNKGVVADNKITTSSTTVHSIHPVQFPFSKRYIAISNAITGANTLFWNMSELMLGDCTRITSSNDIIEGEPSTLANVPQFEEAYIAYNNQVYVFKANPSTSDTLTAQVEDRDLLVGDKAWYDRNYIAQESSFPEANYILFYKGVMWAAGLKGYPHQIRWSGPAPYYRVWPSVQTEVLMENDNSPITGLSVLGESVVVFKNDSIWQMIFTNLDDQNLTTFAPIRVVEGVGAVSNSSVVRIRGELIFLAEDGIYAFNGTREVRKITETKYTKADRLRDTISRITPGRRNHAVATHWKAKSCYLLAVSINGSEENNAVICWNYDRDTWWVWDSIEVKYWIRDEDSNDNEVLYFVNGTGEVFKFGEGKNDHGTAITAYGITKRFGESDYQTKTVRMVQVKGSSSSRSITAEVRSDGNDRDPESGAISTTDPTEYDWGDLEWDSSGTQNNWAPSNARRESRIGFREKGDYFQIKLTHNTKDQPLECKQLIVGYVPHGRR